jgi:hypothetical protein
MVGVTIGGRIYVVGGVVPNAGVVGDLTVYDPATNMHATLAPMPTPREHLAAAAIDGKLYVAGGRSGPLFATLEVYDPATNTWTTKAPMPTPRGGTGAAVLDGRLYVIGGEGARIYPEVEEYDPATDRWRRVANLAVPVHGIYPVTLGGELFVAGGGIVPGYGATNAVQGWKRLPDGVLSYGDSSPACAGPYLLDVASRPLAGSATFAFGCYGGAPPQTAGVLVLGGTPSLGGFLILGAMLHVSLAPPLLLLPVTTDAQGRAAAGVPLPAGSAGLRAFAQLVCANTPSCSGRGLLSATDALAVTVR